MAKKFLINAFLSLVIRILGALSAFIFSLVLVRFLGAYESGLYFLAFSAIAFISTVCRFGFDISLVKYVGACFSSNDWASIVFFIAYATGFVFLSSVCVSAFLYFLSDDIAFYFYNKTDLSTVLKFIAPSILGLSLLTIVSVSLQGLHQFIQSTFFLNILVTAITAAFVFVFNPSLAVDVAGYYSAATFIAFAVALIALLRKLPSYGLERVDSKPFWESSMPLWFVLLMGQTTLWSGQFIAGRYVSPEQLAYLATAHRTALLASFILYAVNSIVGPKFAGFWSKGEVGSLQALYFKSALLSGSLSAPLVCGLLVYPDYVMQMFGQEFVNEAAISALRILAIGQFVTALVGPIGLVLSMTGYERELRLSVFVAAILTVSLSFLLVPRFGIEGSAYAVSVAVIISSIMSVIQAQVRLSLFRR